jgi:ribosomal-protein-alanine N-acetyltransferase
MPSAHALGLGDIRWKFFCPQAFVHPHPRPPLTQTVGWLCYQHKSKHSSHKIMLTLTTERLLIRHFHILDIEPLYRVFGDADVMRYGYGVQTKEWVKDWLHSCFEQYYQTWGFGPYAVIERDSQSVIGYCGLFFFPDVNGQPEIEIGYRLAKSAWGQGYATEAARSIRDFAFVTLGIKRLIAMIDPSNVVSIRVAEKIGMHYERDVMFDGYTHPDLVYAINS